jgi:hypothetical protein
MPGEARMRTLQWTEVACSIMSAGVGTDDPLHEQQQGGFFHGYYDCYCYLLP